MAPPSEGFVRALYGFGWLSHCDASPRLEVRAHARKLARDFLNLPEKDRSPLADHPAVVARRVIAWVTHSGLLAEGEDRAGYERLLDQLARDGALLRFMPGARISGLRASGRSGAGLPRFGAGAGPQGYSTGRATA